MGEIDFDLAFERAVRLKATGTSERGACLLAVEELDSENPKRDMERIRKRLQRARPDVVGRRERNRALKQSDCWRLVFDGRCFSVCLVCRVLLRRARPKFSVF